MTSAVVCSESFWKQKVERPDAATVVLIWAASLILAGLMQNWQFTLYIVGSAVPATCAVYGLGIYMLQPRSFTQSLTETAAVYAMFWTILPSLVQR